MNLNKLLPLTETTYYIMLSLTAPSHGYAIMQKVEELSGGKVRIAAGTLYGALENLTKQMLIESVESNDSRDSRRKVYMLTDQGKEILQMDYERMKHMIDISRDFFESIP